MSKKHIRKRKFKKAYYRLSQAKQKHIQRIVEAPDWTSEELEELGCTLRHEVEKELLMKKTFLAFYGRP